MALTRANAEDIVVDRLGALMDAAGLAVTVAGSNDDLNGPLSWAARQVGVTLASPVTVTDSDLSGISSDDYDDFFDLAEWRTLKNIQGALDLVDVTAGPRSEALSQLSTQVDRMLELRRDHIEEISASRAVAYRYVELDFVAKEE